MRQGLFLALSDVIDAFVVSGKHTSKKKKDVLKEQKPTEQLCYTLCTMVRICQRPYL